MTLGVLHPEILIVEGFAPSLKSEGFCLVDIHGNGFTVQMLYACTVIESRQAGEGEATGCRILDWCSVGRTPGMGKAL